MLMSFLSQVNYLGVVVAALVFFLIGALWFSVLFGHMWAHALKAHSKIVIKEPSKKEFATKLVLTFVANFVACFAMDCLVMVTGSASLLSGLILGIIVAVGFIATTLVSACIWEGRPVKLFLIEVGYPMLGIIAAALILSSWQ